MISAQPNPNKQEYLRVKNVSKYLGAPPQAILSDLNFEILNGQFVTLTGRSGSGKSTLLYLLGSLDRPTSGVIEMNGRDLASMNSQEIHAFRNQNLGFIFQFHYLLPELTAFENVLMPAYKFSETNKYQHRAKEILSLVGLENRMHHLPRALSGGEQQRVAIARALVMKPAFLLADEPTGALDSVNGAQVMSILKKINQEEKTTIIMVTHDVEFSKIGHRRISLADGRIVSDEHFN